MGSDETAPATAFDALVVRMRRDVAALETEKEGALKKSSARLQRVLDAAIEEARTKGAAARAAIGAGAEMLHEEMSAHPAATVSAAFAAGYLVGRSIAGRRTP